MGIDYDLEYKSEEDQSKIRVWGLPMVRPLDPVPLSIWSGLAVGTFINRLRKRPIFSSMHVFSLLGVLLRGLHSKILNFFKIAIKRHSFACDKWNYDCGRNLHVQVVLERMAKRARNGGLGLYQKTPSRFPWSVQLWVLFCFSNNFEVFCCFFHLIIFNFYFPKTIKQKFYNHNYNSVQKVQGPCFALDTQPIDCYAVKKSTWFYRDQTFIIKL